MVTGFPRAPATTPGRRSISARFCPYWPNSTEASLLSSKASTVCVVAVSSEAAPGGITESVVRKGVSNSCCGEDRRLVLETAEKTVAADLDDGHALDRADQLLWRHNLDCLQIWRAAYQLPSQPAGLFEQHIDGAPGKTGVEVALMPHDDGLQALQTFGFFFRRHLIAHLGCGRSRPRRVHERIGAGETDFLDQHQRGLEIGFGLAGEAHDEVRGEGKVGARGTQARNHIEVVAARVPAIHRR